MAEKYYRDMSDDEKRAQLLKAQEKARVEHEEYMKRMAKERAAREGAEAFAKSRGLTPYDVYSSQPLFEPKYNEYDQGGRRRRKTRKTRRRKSNKRTRKSK
jgi:hypothetical protein